ncbi:hypothetical protein [Methylobacterium oxalidis]|uniref:Uncharacterized protein n=1 Tax=Methylobacterium oxalidis TaxID=944322 RepID=A0A512J4L5_9HYPH|nr:hypothetical protein [Methylobacterium oxalidis]GEP04789.1 hypothetical protein MOX02_28270 [Methylobacterium oxalidis]GJE30487.1 hypothetical protein LDDCCGHA_0655 [Methylobacterium oxalidis]GLS63615.1 hypothetical protein GCM10007888_19960 [Methylobacterium oxalidis]
MIAQAAPARTGVVRQDAQQNVVPLFAEHDASGSPKAQDPAEEADWPGAIQLVRDVGARVRRARELAHDLTRQSQVLVQRSITDAEAAEERARVAEAAAQSAMRRAAKSEKAARLAEERARLAEEQMQAAKASEAEARLWLGRLYSCLRSEFDSLTLE